MSIIITSEKQGLEVLQRGHADYYDDQGLS